MLKLELTLNEINYTSIVINTLPKLLKDLGEKDEKVKMLLEILSKHNVLPHVLIANILNSLSNEQIDQVLEEIGNLYSADLVKIINNLLKKEEISIELRSIEISNI